MCSFLGRYHGKLALNFLLGILSSSVQLNVFDTYIILLKTLLDFSIQHKIEEPLFKASSRGAKYAQKMCLYNLQYQQQILERNSFIIIFIFRFSPVEKIIRLDKIAWRLSIIYWVMIYWLRATIPVLGGDIIRFNNDTIFKDFPHDLLLGRQWKL